MYIELSDPTFYGARPPGDYKREGVALGNIYNVLFIQKAFIVKLDGCRRAEGMGRVRATLAGEQEG